jgi:hypothetical protein
VWGIQGNTLLGEPGVAQRTFGTFFYLDERKRKLDAKVTVSATFGMFIYLYELRIRM